MAAPDQLYTLRSLFWLGSYQRALDEAASLHLSEPALVLERDVLVYRTYIALKRFSVVLGEVKDDAGTPEALKAVRLLASHASSTGSPRESACTALSELADSSEDETTALMYATALEADGKHEDALRAVDRDVKSSKLQALALRVVVLLAMHRGDLAEQATAAMVSADDDSALTQLCLAWTHLVAGGDKLGEASLIFQDLTTRFGASALLLNGQAAALIALGSFDDAKKLLVDASSMATAGSSTTINLLALSRLTGEHDAAKRYFEQLQGSDPEHPFAKAQVAAEAELQGIVAKYAGQGAAAATA